MCLSIANRALLCFGTTMENISICYFMAIFKSRIKTYTIFLLNYKAKLHSIKYEWKNCIMPSLEIHFDFDQCTFLGGRTGTEAARQRAVGTQLINTAGTRDYMSGAGHEEKGCTCHINTGSLKSKKMGMILKLQTTNNSLGHSVVMHTYKGT